MMVHAPRGDVRVHAHAGRVQEACGLPIACIIQTFASNDRLASEGPGGLTMSSLVRCQKCFA